MIILHKKKRIVTLKCRLRNIWNCAKTGEITALRELVDRGYETNKLDKLGLAALHWTAKEV